MRRFLRSVGYAWRGIARSFGSERNLRFHGFAALTVIGLGVWLDLAAEHWALLVVAMAGVISAEIFNTAIERLADRVTPEQDDLVRWTKDAAAGGVLVMAIGAVVVGALVLAPSLWAKLSEAAP
jgi:diacylglycerol kinase